MTPERFRAVRAALGLTQAELARVLGYTSRTNVAVFELAGKYGRPVPSAVGKLMDAYEAGWRPADWPSGKVDR